MCVCVCVCMCVLVCLVVTYGDMLPLLQMTRLKAKLNNQAQPYPSEAPPGGKNAAMSKKIADARRVIAACLYSEIQYSF